ncbi:MAG TPA: translation elongation factor 4 [Anaerolineae bacterium]|nr:translation elongation factor 4 [Anaerolineae bacterium]
MDQQAIRNFCIIAHIDHGKSTLADRLLEQTGTVSARDMQEQFLDSMDLEREKGVTIKASAVRLAYTSTDGQAYELNLIDTPGHVDFGYEVSRALAACEGAILVVDASQGVEAQTLANLYLALDLGLDIVPVVNKIDLISARTEEVVQELDDLLGIRSDEVIRSSAKERVGVDQILEAVVAKVPAPKGVPEAPLRALIFDSHYDAYKGVIAYVRVVDGAISPGQMLQLMSNGRRLEPLEIGIFRPHMQPAEGLSTGEVGYVATGLKAVGECSVGDTLTGAETPAIAALPGYQPVKPMVFAGLYPTEGEDYALLRDALEKLQLNDAALSFQPETSQALGFGYRCGFLGLFHMEIIQERLEREYDMDIIFTSPSVAYEVTKVDGTELIIDSPAGLPPENEVEEIREPWLQVQIFSPSEYIGPIMEMVTKRRGRFERMEYLDPRRVLLNYEVPLIEVIVGFHDQLKSHTRGYASMDYHLVGYRRGDLVKLDVLVNKQTVDALSIIVHRDQSYTMGQKLASKMKEVIPRQMFDVPIQAAIGGRVLSRTNVKAKRKDVLAKCYGGDVTRKRKLLEKQKKGKKRMKVIGSVEIPQEAFMSVLRLGDD